MEEKILSILNEINLGQTGWEGNEDVMIFNGKPIGATFTVYLDFSRWWPAFKKELAHYLAEKL